MKKFYFSLNKVLTYKEQTEELLRNDYMQKLALVREQEVIIEKIKEQYHHYWTTLEDGKQNGCTIVFLQAYEKYLKTIQEQLVKEENILEQLKQDAEEKRHILMMAKIERTSIEKLKEKKQEEYQKLVQKEEELLVEEFVSNTALFQK